MWRSAIELRGLTIGAINNAATEFGAVLTHAGSDCILLFWSLIVLLR
jgi:hypothetical protein